MIINSIVLLIFIVSLFYVFRLGSIFFNRNRHLTEEGHKLLGVSLTCLILSGLHLFNVFDFIGYIMK